MVALLLFGDHFFREMAAEAKIYLHAKFRASSLKIKGVMASDPKWRAKCLELVRKMSFSVVGALTVMPDPY